MRVKNKSTSEKLDVILDKLISIDEKVDKQNEEITKLRREMQSLESQVNEMAKKHKVQALVAGGIGGGLAAVGFELLRLKFGG
ncbi:hypothetical protein [Caviibacterium pharyngocola]